MAPPEPRDLLLVGTALAAGMVNAVAGGGTLLTFPALLASGLAPLTANGTSTFALVPGSLASVIGYRRELRGDLRVLAALALPSVAGGALGARLALSSEDALFVRVVPWLILAATGLFAAQEPLRRRLLRPAVTPAQGGGRRLAALCAWQLVVGVYGGYFGAGLGILLLATLGLAGETDVHRMNGLKALAGGCINAAGTITFIAGGRVAWREALLMAAGAIAGGYGGAGLARRIGQRAVRALVVIAGLGLALLMLHGQLARAPAPP